MSPLPTASQTVGPFFSIGLTALCKADIECPGANGPRATIRGRVLDGDAQPVPDAILEVWQVGDAGPRNETFPAGFARVATNERGEFQFTTIKPEARRDADGRVHAPHVAALVFMRGLLRHLLTRIYFSNEAANAEDVALRLVPASRRYTLIATASAGGEEWRWDIHLQGERETVFFEA